MIGAGRLREQIKIRRPVNTKNPATLGLTRGWQDVGTEWAQVRTINGREEVIANTLQGVSTFEITIRYRDDLRPDDQILWLTNGNRELNIVAPPEDMLGNRQWTRLIASTATPQGA